MNQLTILEKIQVLFKLLFSSPIIIGIFVFSLFLMIVLFFNSRLNRKLVKYSFIGIYVLVIGFAFFKYGSYFLTSIDSFLTLFMANIYFPTIPVYVAIMIISFIIMIVTLSSNKRSKVVKIINTVFFTVIQMLFAVFIYVIESNKIDVSSNSNLYTNELTLTLLELGMGLFVIWIIILLIILYFKRADKIFKTGKKDEQDDFDEYINDYNEPKSISDNALSKSISDNLVDVSSDVVDDRADYQIVSDSIDNMNEEILSFDNDNKVDSNISNLTDSLSSISNEDLDRSFIINKRPVVANKVNNNSNNHSIDIFNNFNFLDVTNDKPERRNDDVEVIDFD